MTKEELPVAIAKVEGTISSLDLWVIVFGVIVLVGIAGESYGGYRHWRLDRRLRDLRAVESQQHEIELTQLSRAADDARTKAADAELSLEKYIAGRQITPEQIASIAAALSPLSGQRVWVASYSADAEGARLAMQIKQALEKAGMTVDFPGLLGGVVVGMGIAGGGGLQFGIHMQGMPTDDPAIKAIGDAFDKIGQLRIESPITRPAQISLGRATLGILVGVRPLE